MPNTLGNSLRSPPSPPSIPEQLWSPRMRRLYFLCFGLICQVVKLSVLALPNPSLAESVESYRQWLILDFVYCVALARLGLPGLSYSVKDTLLQVLSLWILNSALLVGARYSDPAVPRISEPLALLDLLNPFTTRSLDSYATKDPHLLGQHIVTISPVITAQLNLDGSTYCLAPTGSPVFIPVLLNDADLVRLSYSFTPLVAGDRGYNHPETVHLTSKKLKAIERIRQKEMQRSSGLGNHGALESPAFSKMQSVVYIQLSKPGTIRLEHVLYSQDVEAQMIYPFEVTVVPCPRAEFIDLGFPSDNVRCSGDDTDVQLMVDVYGIPPLNLKWSKIIGGRREYLHLDGIERGGYTKYDRTPTGDRAGGYKHQNLVPQDMRMPLDISLSTVGDHLYVLDEVVDAVGNAVHMDMSLSSTDKASVTKSKTTRSFIVLRRPTVAFKDCSLDTPTYLKLGTESSLVISGNTSDAFNAGWEVTLKYQPPIDAYRGGRRAAWLTPWERPFTNQGNRRDIHVPVIAPGDYTIVTMKGMRCHGEVLPPDTCRVIERPLPTAEIGWNRLQDCSGDKGISASLLMSGTPPFQVTFNVQRGDDLPQEISKTFDALKGEINIQPSRSGRYIFNFIRIGDAHYQRVELQGPKIEQSIPEAAMASFTSGKIIPGSNKRLVDSCDTGVVGVDVELKGTAPWTLEVSVGGSRSPTLVRFPGIRSSPKTLDIPIPEAVEKNGGTFEIYLASVEDARKCKQIISTPGILFNIKTLKPTVRFVGEEHERTALVLEDEPAGLPLALTGDAPWLIRCRREEADNFTRVLTARLDAPSGNLSVTQQGLFHIIDVVDARCPGTVHPHASSYRVNWIPRPSATLSPQTSMTYEAFNRSYILRPTCQGVVDHVNIEISGRPPFHLVYIIVEDTSHGAKLSYNPTYYSTLVHSQLQLQTSHVGRVFYEISQVGDLAYPLAKYKSRTIPRHERILFEQQIFVHPSAGFKSQGRLSYFLHDAFVASASPSSDGIVILEGAPPFRLHLTIKHMSTRQVDSLSVDVPHHTWRVDMPSYTFKTIGPHLISIESVSDMSNCAHVVALKSPSRSIFVDVNAGAAIVPYGQREHFCVGDTASFHLEGIAPWIIGYRINSNSYTKEIKTPPFSVLLERSGDFVITSLTQPHTRRTVALNLPYFVHARPSASVAYGRRIYQDINEGDQAEIVFTLIGSPPFTFTYQRSEINAHKNSRPGNILETHTVSHLTTNSYTIYASLEGKWEVASTADSRCRYP